MVGGKEKRGGGESGVDMTQKHSEFNRKGGGGGLFWSSPKVEGRKVRWELGGGMGWGGSGWSGWGYLAGPGGVRGGGPEHELRGAEIRVSKMRGILVRQLLYGLCFYFLYFYFLGNTASWVD